MALFSTEYTMTSINDIIQWSANCLKRHGCAIINRRIFQEAKSRSAVVRAWTDEQVAEMIATQTKSQHRLGPDDLVLNDLRQPPLPADDSTNTKDAAR